MLCAGASGTYLAQTEAERRRVSAQHGTIRRYHSGIIIKTILICRLDIIDDNRDRKLKI